MDICDCMYEENELGQSVCRLCHGDVYACDCPLVHTRRCDEERRPYKLLYEAY